MTPTSLLTLWRGANHMANVAEDALFKSSMAYARGEGPAPREGVEEEILELRKRAAAFFKQGIKELGATWREVSSAQNPSQP